LQQANKQIIHGSEQGCGSGLDPDSVTLWIRIRIGNPDPGIRKLIKLVEKWKTVLFSYFFSFTTGSYKIAKTFDEYYIGLFN
jgi:hypothetical protein